MAADRGARDAPAEVCEVDADPVADADADGGVTAGRGAAAL
jgi:hypothetical protein